MFVADFTRGFFFSKLTVLLCQPVGISILTWTSGIPIFPPPLWNWVGTEPGNILHEIPRTRTHAHKFLKGVFKFLQGFLGSRRHFLERKKARHSVHCSESVTRSLITVCTAKKSTVQDKTTFS